MTSLIACVLLGAAAYAVSVVILHVPAPDLAVVSQPPSRVSTAYSADGSVLAYFRPEELHAPVPPGAIPPNVRAAVLAAEDRSFDSHDGVDPAGIMRAVIEGVAERRFRQGGSTITQQLAKNLFTDGRDTLGRKLHELRVALAMERVYSKNEILAAYLNTTYLGESAIGIGAAAHAYFRKPAGELSLSEAALLASVIPRPSAYNPRVNAELAEERRRRVLRQVEDAGFASSREVDAALAERPVVHPAREGPPKYPYFADFVRRFLLDNEIVRPANLFGGGLRIETTVEPPLQDAALARAARMPAGGPVAAVVVLDNHTGHVRALVGGRDWEASRVNLALGRDGGGTGRQAGSSFKPFVLARLLEHGARPGDLLAAPAQYLPSDGKKPVHNYTGRGYGQLTLLDATRWSVNTAYVRAVERVGPDNVAALARAAFVPVPKDVGTSIALGAYEVDPLSMARGFAMFAREGAPLKTSPVTRVTDADGRTVFEWKPPRMKPVIEPGIARTVTQMLKHAVNSGTGQAARMDRPVAGKTGTTNAYANAWFVGYTARTSAAVWVGYPGANRPMRNVAGVARVTGGSIPAAIWRDVMAGAVYGRAPEPFPPPPQLP